MSSRAFGCEFEFSSFWDDTEPVVRDAILRVYGPRKLTVRHDWMKSRNNRSWHMKEDGSTIGEVVTPVSTGKDLERICRVVEMLGKGGVKAGENDGFHVHVRGSDVDRRYVVASWTRAEAVLLQAFPRHRRDNEYCETLSDQVDKVGFKGLMELAYEHHSALSLSRLKRRGTIEFRLAEGTFDPDFVFNWTTFCVKFVDRASAGDPYELLLGGKPPTLRRLMGELGLGFAGFFEARRRRFS